MCNPGFGGDGMTCTKSGDGCENAIDINPAKLPYMVNGDTSSNSSDHFHLSAGDCGNASAVGVGAPDKLYTFTPAVDADYGISVTTSAFDAVVYVLTECGISGSSSASASSASASSASSSSASSSASTGAGGASSSSGTGGAPGAGGAMSSSSSGAGGSGPSGGVCVVETNKMGASGTESAQVSLKAGTTYYIIVDGASGADSGNYSLSIGKIAKAVQIDVSSVLLHDTVINNGNGLDNTQDPMDATNHCFATSTVVQTWPNQPASAGLPDDGVFPADIMGGTHPIIQLHWNNNEDNMTAKNSRIVLPGEPAFTIPINAQYDQIQVYGVSAEGASAMDFTIHYADNTTDVRTIPFNDWFNSNPDPATFFLVANLTRGYAKDQAGNLGGTYTGENPHPSVTAANLNPQASKKVVSIDVQHTPSLPNIKGWFTFYGVTAW
jgi:hypothetical protein